MKEAYNINEEDKLQILYISSVCSEDMYGKLEKTLKKPMQYSIQKFHNLIIKGIDKNNNTSITALCGVPIDRSNTKKTIFFHYKSKRNNVMYKHIGFLNIPIIKQIGICLGMIIHTLIWCIKNIKYKNKFMICDAAYVTVVPILVMILKILKIKKVAIVADIYDYMSDKIIERNNVNFIKKIITKMCTYCWKNFDGYVLLTEEMDKIVNPNNKSFIVMEGISEDDKVKEKEMSKNYIMYAGSLYDRFGIKDLVDGFNMINNKNIELHLYGMGDSIPYIIEKSKENSNIKYMGTKTNSEILDLEREAYLLINPRPTTGEFTKYSFPSKTMEYMLTGTPVLMTKLPGLPKDYYEHLYFINNETAEGIRDSINIILDDVPKKNLIEKGKNAQEFILNNKNNVFQAKRILEMAYRIL